MTGEGICGSGALSIVPRLLEIVIYGNSYFCKRVRTDLCMALMLLLLLLLCGDNELNPGPVKYPCGVCQKAVKNNGKAICCDECDIWFWSILRRAHFGA